MVTCFYCNSPVSDVTGSMLQRDLDHKSIGGLDRSVGRGLGQRNLARSVWLLPGHSFELPVPVELADDLRIFPPVLKHFHVKLQKNLGAQNGLQFLAR